VGKTQLNIKCQSILTDKLPFGRCVSDIYMMHYLGAAVGVLDISVRIY